jgi:hypothetical protein
MTVNKINTKQKTYMNSDVSEIYLRWSSEVKFAILRTGIPAIKRYFIVAKLLQNIHDCEIPTFKKF